MMVWKGMDIESNRNHHKKFFLKDYEEIGWALAQSCVDIDDLLYSVENLVKRAKNMDNNRRENAVHMGVSISESDQIYNLDQVYKSVEEKVQRIKDMRKMFTV